MSQQARSFSVSRKYCACGGSQRPRTPPVHATANSSPFTKLGQVLREKARGDFDRVFKGTEKTRQKLSVVDELLTYWNIDEADDQLEELEDALICVDFGPKTAFKITDEIREKILKGELKTGDDLRKTLRSSIVNTLKERGGDTALRLPDDAVATGGPAVVLIVGVNGAGKTTTVGKIAHKLSAAGGKVMLGSGDTFRAAAYEQLGTWAERSGASMGPYNDGDTPQQVLAGTVKAAQESKSDVVLCDTSGRLHTNWRLMDELQLVVQDIDGVQKGAPHETLLVLDGSTGLNMMNQAKEFSECVPISGIILTKLDGSGRGGAVVSVVDQLGIPVKFVGVGEGIEDLQPFDCDSFVDSLFPEGEVSSRSIADVSV